jgi:glycosyltransferase involved in cell wall biosynthesis
MSPIFSIIIPAFNEARHISQCLDSIFAQRFPRDRYEVIVVDNGSTDATPAIAARYPVTLLSNHEKTVSGLRNLGASHAIGEILAFVDADCTVAPDWLESASVYIDQPDVAMWGAPPLPPENPTWVQKTWSIVRLKDNIKKEVVWLGTINIFLRKELFWQVGGFNEALETCEDVDLCYKISKTGKIISDNKFKIVHLGEDVSLAVFFKKEMWRGKSSYKGLFSHGLSIKEIPSLAIPIYFGVLMPLVYILAILFSEPVILVVLFCLWLMPFAAVFSRLRMSGRTLKDCGRLLVLLQVYFAARTLAVLKS